MPQGETIHITEVSMNKSTPAHQLSKTAIWSSAAGKQKSIKVKDTINQ